MPPCVLLKALKDSLISIRITLACTLGIIVFAQAMVSHRPIGIFGHAIHDRLSSHENLNHAERLGRAPFMG